MGTYTQSFDQNQPDQPRAWGFDREWLEPRLVAVTFIALVFSVVAQHAQMSSWVILTLNITTYIAGGFYGLQEGLKSLSERKVDVDLLMILAALGAASIGNWHEGAILLFLFSLSNVLQDYAIGKSRQAIRSLLKLYPSEAQVRRDGVVRTVDISAIRVGEIVLIEPGERIPVDGVIVAGRSTVNQAPITGESMPVEKHVGDRVFAGTLNQQGSLDVEALQPASDTILARIIRMVEDAQESKAPTERFLDEFEQKYALFIIAAVALYIIVPPLLGLTDFSSNFYRAMVLMTVASPCALVISTPAAFISAIASAARGGVLFKGGAYLEGLAGVKAIAFDKTGTLTHGKPVVTDLQPLGGHTDADLLALVASVESRSEHPLAQAIINAATERDLTLIEVDDFQAEAGRGVSGIVGNDEIRVGSPAAFADLPESLRETSHTLEAEGKTVILAQRNGAWLGMIALADEIRPEAKAMIDALHARHVKVAMLTGDNARVAQTVAAQLGVDIVHAGLMPEDKVNVIRTLQAEHGTVAMVGDGVNDAPALATASIGIAMGAAGTDVALETADLVLMGDKLERIPYAIQLSQKARRVVWQNIAFSLAVIVMLVISTFAVSLPLPLGVLGHEGSTVIVVLNGLITLLLIPEWQRRRAASA